jgi:hypothetical protein
VNAISRQLPWYFETSKGDFVVLVLRSTQRFIRNTSGLVGLLLVSILGIGCSGYTQKAVPGLSVSSTSLNFQTVAVGQTLSKTFTISNSGTAPLQISTLSVSNAEFSLTGPSIPRTILPANSVSYTLTFAPTTSGLASANVNVSTDSVTQARLISLVGKGASAFANLAITPSSLSFGAIALKSTSTQNVTLQNTGDSSLSLQGVSLSGTGFSYSNLSPGFSIAPNQAITFKVSFSPKVAGPASATLTFMSSNFSSPETLSMTGDGVSSTTSAPTPSPTAEHTVSLNWQASPSQVIGYRVYRSETSGGNYNPLNGTAITDLNYSDSTVVAGNTYYYVVAAVNAAGAESSYSNQATAVIP